MGALIGSVKVTPAQAAPGQSVQVQVLDPSGKPYVEGNGVTIALDGVPVASRWYQFATAGKRTIAVYAAGNGQVEVANASVDITGAPIAYRRMVPAVGQPPAPTQLPFITVKQSIGSPYQATFSLTTPPAARAAAAKALAAADKANEGKPPPAAKPAQIAPAAFTQLHALFPIKTGPQLAAGQHLLVRQPIHPPAPPTSYVWTFGDGATATTDSPTVTHDYFPAIKPGQVPFAFDVSCHIAHDNVTVTRTLVLYSTYGMCQRNGMTVPTVTGDAYASLNANKTTFSASVVVHNIEATPITLSEMAIMPVWHSDGAAYPPFAFKKMAKPVTIAPHSSSLLGVQAARSDLNQQAHGAAVTGFIVAFQGALAAPVLHAGPRALAASEPVAAAHMVTPAVVAARAAASTPVSHPARSTNGGQPAPAASKPVDTALANALRPGGIVFRPGAPSSTVRFTWHVRIPLQDQQLPPPARGLVALHPSAAILQTLAGAAALKSSSVVKHADMTVDAATNVVSVPLTTATPAPLAAAQVRHSVLSVLNTAAGA